MSQYGMQMPGARGRRSASMNIYTGLLFLAVVALGTASAFMYLAAVRVGPEGSPFKLHEKATNKELPLKARAN